MSKRYLAVVALAAAWSVLAPFSAELGVEAFSAMAAEGEEKPQKTRRIPAMSEATYKKLTEAQEFIDAKDLDSALGVLDAMLDRKKRMNGNEIGQVYNMRGFIYFSKENYRQAIREYEQVIAQGEDIPEGLETTTLYTLAQLSFVADEFDEALRYMRIWLSKAVNPGPAPHIFMGQVYYQKKDYASAIEQIETGIRLAKERQTPVKENWWALLNYLYFEQENYDKVLEILEILVEDFPKRDYWVRLAGIHGQEGNEKEQVYAMEAAYVAGFLDRERELMSLAGLLMQDQVPWRAAQVMEKGFADGLIEETPKNLQNLGQAWQLSQETEKAIPVFEQAAILSDDGKISDRLSQVYLDDDQFDRCITAAADAIEKGGLRRVQQTYIVKGMCQYNLKKKTAARGSFVSCRNSSRVEKDESNERVCNQWIRYIDREIERDAVLEAAI